MKITIRTIWLWLLIFLPFLCISLFILYKTEESVEKKDRQTINVQIGKKFPTHYLYNLSGKEVILDFAKNHTTIIDFWFAGCKPCIEEMAQFSDILSQTEEPITIVSISLDKPSSWSQLLTPTARGKLSFLSEKVNNWEHYVLNPPETEKDPFSLLKESLGVKLYPAYFVVDRNGKIVATPASAVKYLKIERAKASGFIDFTIGKAKSKDAPVGSLFLFIFYSGLFWMVIVLTFVTKRIKAGKNFASK